MMGKKTTTRNRKVRWRYSPCTRGRWTRVQPSLQSSDRGPLPSSSRPVSWHFSADSESSDARAPFWQNLRRHREEKMTLCFLIVISVCVDTKRVDAYRTQTGYDKSSKVQQDSCDGFYGQTVLKIFAGPENWLTRKLSVSWVTYGTESTTCTSQVNITSVL